MLMLMLIITKQVVYTDLNNVQSNIRINRPHINMMNSRSSAIRNYFETTSLHAIPEIYATRSIRRLCWIFIFLCATGGSIYEIYQVCYQYSISPLITTYDVKTTNALKFPHVEICPTSTVSYKKMTEKKIHPVYVQKALQLTFAWRKLMTGAMKKMLPKNFSHSEYSPILYQINRFAWFEIALGRSSTLEEAMSALRKLLQSVGNINTEDNAIREIYSLSYCYLSEGLKTGHPQPMFHKSTPPNDTQTSPADKISAAQCNFPIIQEMLMETVRVKLLGYQEHLKEVQTNFTTLANSIPTILAQQIDNETKATLLGQRYMQLQKIIKGNDHMGLEIRFLMEKLKDVENISDQLRFLSLAQRQVAAAIQDTLYNLESSLSMHGSPSEQTQLVKDENLELIDEITSMMFPSEDHHKALISLFDHKANPFDVESFLRSLALDKEDLFGGCYFMLNEMDCQNITELVFDQEFGWCFLTDIKHNQHAAGLGFRALINLNTSDYFRGEPSSEDGIVIRIADGFDPVSFKGIRIPPGSYANVELSATKYKLNDDQSYGTCNHDMDRQVTTTPYTDTVCRHECFSQYITTACNCRVPFFPKNYIMDKWKDKTCDKLSQLKCTDKALADASDMENVPTLAVCYKQCKPPCDHWAYKQSVTYSRFPSEGLSSALKDYDPAVASHTWAGSKILFHLSFDAIQYVEVVQHVSITPDGFISQIGGHLGLFLGASLVSAFQIVDLLITCCFRKGKVCAVETETNDDVKPQEPVPEYTGSIPHQRSQMDKPARIYSMESFPGYEYVGKPIVA